MPSRPLAPVLARTAIRGGALVALDLLLLLAAERTSLGDDPLGAGLVAFLVWAVVAGLWGTWDGARARTSFGVLATTWVVAAVAFSLVGQVVRAVAYGPTTVEVVVSDLLLLTPTTVGLVVGPALVGAALAASLRRPDPVR